MQALIKELATWFSAVMDDLYDEWPDHIPGGVLMGCPIWGREYRTRFERYCLPTLFAPENLAALSGRCRLVIFAGGEDRAPLLRMLKPLEHHGIEFVLKTIPEAVLKHNKEIESYPILGCVQNILIQMAGRYCMNLHMLMCDHSYSERYARGLFRLGKQWEAVVQCGICLDEGSAAWEIEQYRTPDKELVIPSDKLGDLAWRHLHKRMSMLVVNKAPAGQMPHSHFLMYQGRDRLHIYSPHMNPVWLSARLCLKAEMPAHPKDLVATIDTRLPGLINKTPTYIVQPEDEMTVVEVSGPMKGAPERYVDFDTFAMRAWRQIGFSGSFGPFFGAPTYIAIAPQDKFMTDEEIAERHRDTIDRMEALKALFALEAYQKLVGTWKPETQPSPIEDPEYYADIVRGITARGLEAKAGSEGAGGSGAEADRGRQQEAPGNGGEGERGEEGRAGVAAGGPVGRPAAHRTNGSVPPRTEAGL